MPLAGSWNICHRRFPVVRLQTISNTVLEPGLLTDIRLHKKQPQCVFHAWQTPDKLLCTFNWICQCGVNPVSAPGPVTIWSGNDIWRIMSVPRSAGTRVLLTGKSLTVGSSTYTTGSWCADQHLITEISKFYLVKQPCKSLGKSITILPDCSLSYGTGTVDSMCLR